VSELFAVTETQVVGADVLVERGFGFEGCAAGVLAGPGLEVVVFGGEESGGSTCVAGLFVVDGLDVHGEVVLAVEDAGAVWLGAWVLGLLGGVGVDGVEVGPEVRVVLEALTAFCALGWVELLDMRDEFLLCCERHKLWRRFDHVARIRVQRLGSWTCTYHAEQTMLLLAWMDLESVSLECTLRLVAVHASVTSLRVHEGARVGLYLLMLRLDVCL
jgi:hypothetical protein